MNRRRNRQPWFPRLSRPSPNMELFVMLGAALLALLMLAGCARAAPAAPAAPASPAEVIETEAQQKQREQDQAAALIIGASVAMQIHAINELVRAQVPREAAEAIVASRCHINYDALVEAVLTVPPVPTTVGEAVAQSIAITERLCPKLRGAST